MIGRWLCRIGRHRMVEELGLGALSIWSCERRGCGHHVVLSNWNIPASRIVRGPMKLQINRQKGFPIPPDRSGWSIPPKSEIWDELRPWSDASRPPPPRPNVSGVFRPYRHR